MIKIPARDRSGQAVLALTCALTIGGRQAPSGAPAPVIAPSATHPASQPTTQPDVKTVKPFDDVTVIIDSRHSIDSRVEVAAFTCLDSGWLEQVACAPATREHESLLVIKAKPSELHAALLMAGFEPGKPGRWTYQNDKFGAINPTGSKLAVLVRYRDADGKEIEQPVGKWMRGPDIPGQAPKAFPDDPWVFGGSLFAPNPPDMGPGEHYVADESGSIIGLVTFGDETIGYSKVLADQEAVQEPAWEANTQAMPRVGTPVTVILRSWNKPEASPTTAPND